MNQQDMIAAHSFSNAYAIIALKETVLRHCVKDEVKAEIEAEFTNLYKRLLDKPIAQLERTHPEIVALLKIMQQTGSIT